MVLYMIVYIYIFGYFTLTACCSLNISKNPPLVACGEWPSRRLYILPAAWHIDADPVEQRGDSMLRVCVCVCVCVSSLRILVCAELVAGCHSNPDRLRSLSLSLSLSLCMLWRYENMWLSVTSHQPTGYITQKDISCYIISSFTYHFA